MMIEDGTGSGRKAAVDSKNRVNTISLSVTEEQANAELGYTYNVNTGDITLTTANESAVLYLDNTGTNDLKISQIGYLIGNSTGGSGDLSATVQKNPTGGTIVDNAVAVSIKENKNFGSTRTLTADVYKGVEGDTITGGADTFKSLLATVGQVYSINTGSIIIPRGSSIGVSITPQPSNTSMTLQVFLAITEDVV